MKDHCGCCFECAKQLNETCGGYLGRLGKCDIGLLCHSYFPSDIPLIPGVCAKLGKLAGADHRYGILPSTLAGCLLINDGDNKWIAVGHTISRRRSCKTWYTETLYSGLNDVLVEMFTIVVCAKVMGRLIVPNRRTVIPAQQRKMMILVISNAAQN